MIGVASTQTHPYNPYKKAIQSKGYCPLADWCMSYIVKKFEEVLVGEGDQ